MFMFPEEEKSVTNNMFQTFIIFKLLTYVQSLIYNFKNSTMINENTRMNSTKQMRFKRNLHLVFKGQKENIRFDQMLGNLSTVYNSYQGKCLLSKPTLIYHRSNLQFISYQISYNTQNSAWIIRTLTGQAWLERYFGFSGYSKYLKSRRAHYI